MTRILPTIRPAQSAKPGIYHNGQPVADWLYRDILASNLSPAEARTARDKAMGRKEQRHA